MAGFTQTPFMDGQIFANNFAGKRARLCLALNTGSLSEASTTAQWDAAEINGNGYARVEWTIPSGSFNATTARFEAPSQLASFLASANGAGLTWNTAYIVLGTIANNVTTWQTGISYLYAQSVAVAPGQPKSYHVTFFADGITVSS